jgi:hypothetical protein
VPLFRNFTANINRSAAVEAATEATLIAESALDALGARLPLAAGESIGDEGRFTVAASVEPFEGENVVPSGRYVVPYQLVVNVSWEEGHRRQSVTLRTVRLAGSAQQ